MGAVMLIASLISPLLELMKLAEADFASAPKSGADKKAAVLSGIQAVVNDQAMWGKISSFMSSLIDVMSKIHLGSK